METLSCFCSRIAERSMNLKPNFKVILLEEALRFISSLPVKVQDKITSNIRKSTFLLDPKFFKKLDNEIWEFRTLYNNIQYRLLAFWDHETETLVVATHGFVKKTQKTPHKEIDRANTDLEWMYKKRREPFCTYSEYGYRQVTFYKTSTNSPRLTDVSLQTTCSLVKNVLAVFYSEEQEQKLKSMLRSTNRNAFL